MATLCEQNYNFEHQYPVGRKGFNGRLEAVIYQNI